MGRLLLSLPSHRVRSLHHARNRVAIVFFIGALIFHQHMYLVSRQSLSAKYTATNFNSRAGDLRARFPPEDGSRFQAELLANRQDWEVLGEGFEGKVFAYQDSVIKTFTPGQSPFRNCAPSTYPTAKWPTEIPAQLRFGGSSLTKVRGSGHVEDAKIDFKGFLPLKAHFMASNSPGSPAEWHLVTPLLKGGTLTSLAKKLSTEPQTKSYREIDALYRPAFNRLLVNMAAFHDAGYCHDDIKPSNIFIKDDSQWVMGDLGNVRELSHPFHSSRIWTDNKQLADCRANDVVRVLRSYLKFIQSSLPDPEPFNTALFQAAEPTSKLLWWTLADAPNMSAQELRQRSFFEYPEAAPAPDTDERFPPPVPPRRSLFTLFSSERSVLGGAADAALRTSMNELSARLWAWVGLFGVPEGEICEA
ncbi:uncharacterized protein SETTUDRAFT_105665 [Exserohilum turcica Et28A]|uniref:Protein kinase domain-containing protein n=1 Tax=Exserohilum turcicum (strain 28A) TaxID=671987 RepID=R0IXA5_EXST2|nr:uncharacterized protein SETTUDRAFT_105665 [Exserohilum turcica Et28A]EOA89196.1 hypothetical protein SETTUDRAFT_105665 [Exserohilum turcica Et28A]